MEDLNSFTTILAVPLQDSYLNYQSCLLYKLDHKYTQYQKR